MRIGFIGGGNIAEAIIDSVLKAGMASKDEIVVSDINPGRREYLATTHRVKLTADNTEVIDAADMLVLAVKPQVMQSVLEPLGPRVSSDHLVVTLAAGKRLATIESLLPHARVVRVMPNLPCQVGLGMSVYCLGTKATSEDGDTVRSLCECFGKCMTLPEELFDAVTAVSGSGPAFFAYLAEAIARAGVAEGIDYEDAHLLSTQTMLGSAAVLLASGESPQHFIRRVKSPGGTTEAGLGVLEPSDVVEILTQTIHAAVERGRELAQ
jgi:pyrroline-5-carboxylate reductase